MRRPSALTLITVLAIAGTLALTGSVVGPVGISQASSGGVDWRSDLDAASTALPTPAQPTVQARTKSLIRTSASSPKATAVAVASTTCDGCSGEATTFQVVYFDGKGPVAADNVATAIAQCPDCVGPVATSAVAVQVVIARRADQLTVNNSAFAANVLCGPQGAATPPPTEVICSTSAVALQFVLVGGGRRDLTALAKTLTAQLQDALADRLSSAPPAPPNQALARAQTETASIADQLQAVLVKDTGSTTVQRTIDVKVG